MGSTDPIKTSIIHTVNREEFIAPIPEEERHDMMSAYHAQLNSADEETRLRAAKAWSKWEYVHLVSLSIPWVLTAL